MSCREREEGELGECFTLGCVNSWLGGWAGNSGAGQGEEEDQSEVDSGRLPTEHVSADWAGWKGRERIRTSVSRCAWDKALCSDRARRTG